MTKKAKKTVLSPKQEEFCQQYVLDKNATQAALRANYAEKSAASQASALLQKPKISARINQLIEARHERIHISADRVLQEIASIAMVEVDHFSTWDGKEFKIKPFNEMHPIAKKAIKNIRSTTVETNVKYKTCPKTGDEIRTVGSVTTYMDLTLHSKDKSLEMMAKHFKLLDGNEGDIDNELDDALEVLESEEQGK